jgi:hypothetical protein
MSWSSTEQTAFGGTLMGLKLQVMGRSGNNARNVMYARRPHVQRAPVLPAVPPAAGQRSRCSRMSSSIDLKSDSRASARVARVLASARAVSPPVTPRSSNLVKGSALGGLSNRGRS